MDCLRIKRNTHRSRVVGFKVIKYIVAALSVILLAVACQDSETPAAHPSLRTVNLPRLISAEEFYSASYESWEHQISPDGRKLAWIQWAKGKSRLHVRVLESGRLAVLKHRRPSFASTGRAIAGTSCSLRRPRTARLASVPGRYRFSRHGPSRTITPFDEVSVRQIVTPLSKPESVLVGMNLSNNLTYDLYEINLETSQHKRIRTNHGRTSRWIVSREGRAIARLQNTRGGGWELQALDERGRWERVLFGTLEDSIAIEDNAPDDRRTVYMQTIRGETRLWCWKWTWRTANNRCSSSHPMWMSLDSGLIPQPMSHWLSCTTMVSLAITTTTGICNRDIEGILDRGPML